MVRSLKTQTLGALDRCGGSHRLSKAKLSDTEM
jgi:hypothetical protein